MLTDIDKEFDTPEIDENGELIEVIEEDDVFIEEDTGLEEQPDSFYEDIEDDIVQEGEEEEELDNIQEVTVEAKENYENAKEQLVAIFLDILERGEITPEDNIEIEQVKEQYSEAYNSIKENTENVQKKTLEERVQELEDGMVGSKPDEILAILTDNGRKPWLYTDEDNNVLMDGTAIPELTVLAQKLSLIATDGDDESSIVLTPTMIQMIAESDIQLSAKKILINGLLEGKGWRVTEEGILDIKELNAVKATIGTLEADEIIADIIHGNTADIGDLTADIGKIETLVGGNLTMDNIASLILTSKKVTVEDAFIKNAMIDSVSAAKINTGILNTNLVNIQSEDGSLVLNGTLQQFKDQNGKVRIQMGKDAQGNFTFGLFDATGTGTLINSDGITEKAIGDGLIIDKMVGDNANISGNKLDIDSVITEVNNGASTIKGTKVKLDEQNQTLDVAFNSMTTTVTEQGKAVGSHTTSINVMKGQIGTLISDTEILEEGNKVTVKDAYSKLNIKVNEFGVSLKDTQSEFDNMVIGTRNLIKNSAPKDASGWNNANKTNYKCELIDCTAAPRGKSIKVTNLVIGGGGVYVIPINKDSLINGASYTISAMVRGSKNGIVIKFMHEQMTELKYVNTSTDWKRVSITGVVNTSLPNKGVVFYPNSDTVSPGDWFEMHSLMFTQSSKEGNYIEAPEDSEDTLNALGTRVKNAENTLTLDGLTTIIGSTYITPTQLNSKGYASTSDVTQAVNSWTAKFSESGGYNELYNGDFRNNFTHWVNYGSNTIITDSSCPTTTKSVRLGGAIGTTKQIYQTVLDLNYQGQMTVSLWAFVTSSGNDGTTNKFIGAQATITYTDNTKAYPGIQLFSKYDTWERRSFIITPPEGKRIKHVEVAIICRDTTRVCYISDIILSKGSIIVPFSPNPNEVYDGITRINKDGIKVTQSNINGYTNMNADGFFLNDGTGDVFKVTSQGAYFKGAVNITNGSISESALAGTMIDGKYIKTDTILAQSIKIGDFTNYCTKPHNYTMNNGSPSYMIGANSTQGLNVSENLTHLKGGETFHISGKVFAPSANAGQTNFNVYFYWVGADGANLGNTYVAAPAAPNTTIDIDLKLVVPERPTGAQFGYFRATCGNALYNLFWWNPTIRLMMSGNLIVDGAIDGKTIRGAEIIGGEIKSIAVNEDGSPIFSLSSDGKIVGGYIDCYGLNVEGDVSADTLSINSINNSRYPQALDEDITVYINTSVISDEEMFDGAKFSCMEDLFAVAPRNLNGYTIFIIFETDYTGNINLSGFNSGSCYVYLQKHTIRGYISCYGKSMRYAIYGNARGLEGGSANCANIKPPKGRSMSGYAYSLICDYTTMTAYDLNIYPGVDTSVIPSGIIVTNLSNAYLNNINAVGKPQHLVRSHSTSQVYIAESSGLSSGNTFSAVSGSIQCLNPVNQAGSSIGKPTYTSGNAQIFSSGVTFAQADNSGSNDSGSSTIEVTTVTLKANSGDTYRRTVYNSWKKDGTVRQGDYGYGDCDGFWFFGSQISNYTGKNITKVAITIKRNTGAGNSQPVTHTLVGHKYSSRPSGTPDAMGSVIRSSFNLSQGSSVTLNLTAAEIAIFKKYKGIGLKAPYSPGYYSSCSASCTVKITYED